MFIERELFEKKIEYIIKRLDKIDKMLVSIANGLLLIFFLIFKISKSNSIQLKNIGFKMKYSRFNLTVTNKNSKIIKRLNYDYFTKNHQEQVSQLQDYQVLQNQLILVKNNVTTNADEVKINPCRKPIHGLLLNTEKQGIICNKDRIGTISNPLAT